MTGRYIITFDKSQEDIPVLIVGHENNYFYGLAGTPSMKIVNTITGERALELWNELTKEAEKDAT